MLLFCRTLIAIAFLFAFFSTYHGVYIALSSAQIVKLITHLSVFCKRCLLPILQLRKLSMKVIDLGKFRNSSSIKRLSCRSEESQLLLMVGSESFIETGGLVVSVDLTVSLRNAALVTLLAKMRGCAAASFNVNQIDTL